MSHSRVLFCLKESTAASVIIIINVDFVQISLI